MGVDVRVGVRAAVREHADLAVDVAALAKVVERTIEVRERRLAAGRALDRDEHAERVAVDALARGPGRSGARHGPHRAGAEARRAREAVEQRVVELLGAALVGALGGAELLVALRQLALRRDPGHGLAAGVLEQVAAEQAALRGDAGGERLLVEHGQEDRPLALGVRERAFGGRRLAVLGRGQLAGLGRVGLVGGGAAPVAEAQGAQHHHEPRVPPRRRGRGRQAGAPARRGRGAHPIDAARPGRESQIPLGATCGHGDAPTHEIHETVDGVTKWHAGCTERRCRVVGAAREQPPSERAKRAPRAPPWR